MPFQSEKQRRYLWANEPEIARDWTDTYGSRIGGADGGIMRLPFAEGEIVEEVVVDDNDKTYEESPYSNKYTEEEFNEVFGKTDSSFIDQGWDKVKDLHSGITQWASPLWNAYKGNLGGAAIGSMLGPFGALAGAFAGGNLQDSRFYKGATTGAGGYTADQLNRMNALGGWYSGPARAARQFEKRGLNVLDRAAAGKPVGNVTELLGKYGYEGGDLGSGDISFTGQPEGNSKAGAGFSRDEGYEGGWGRSPFRGGGILDLWPR